jgi:hypothetical protein
MKLENNKDVVVCRLNLTEYEKNLYSVKVDYKDKRLEYFSMQARNVDADYFYCFNSSIENNIVPFIYIYDERNKTKASSTLDLIKVNKQLWTLGEVALAVVIYSNEIVILDTRRHIDFVDGEEVPAVFDTVIEIDNQLKKRIFEGKILEESNNYKDVSPYELLLKHIEKNILNDKKRETINCSDTLLRKALIKFIFIKYLEEQTDENDVSVFSKKFFSQYLSEPSTTDADTFCDVIRSGDIVRLLRDLSNKFNGGIFSILPSEEEELRNADLSIIGYALDGNMDEKGQFCLSLWRYYDFNLLPIEFISRLYERFVISVDDESQKNTGAYYTPPHLARLLIDELLPFDKQIDFDNFRILDPTCGSGVFLALAYKRLITLWLLSEKKTDITGIEDINTIKNILTKCIYGVDINDDALAITATSLQIELCSHIHPKDIWESLRFDNLVDRGNLTQLGFFKWYKTISAENKFDIIVGNPPFNLDKKQHLKDVENGIDDYFHNEVYSDYLNKLKDKKFPVRNPALVILYKSLNYLLKDDVGVLFLIMPSSSFLYMPSSQNYRQNIAYRWNIRKIFDFTTLRRHLWGKTNVATVAVKIDNEKSINSYNIEHIVVKNSQANENGVIRFLIDKYDIFNVPIDYIFTKNKEHIWKTNLLGGGRLELFVEKFNVFSKIGAFFSNKKIEAKTGFQRDSLFINDEKNKDNPRLQNLRGKDIIDVDLFISDCFSEAMLLPKIQVDDFARVPIDVLTPPNILMRLSSNHNFPIFYNDSKSLYFSKGLLGIKGSDIDLMSTFVDVFKQNRFIYSILSVIYSAQSFTTQEGGYTINKREVLNLPISLDSEKGSPIAFNTISNMDISVIEDTELIANCLMASKSSLFSRVDIEELNKYEDAFCEVLNLIYENRNYKFRPVRRIISEDIIWLTFEHTDTDKDIEYTFTQKNKELYNTLLVDKSANSLIINRIVTSYSERNRISFIKPNKLKYWMRTIAYRDAEDVKADMYKKGY